ncbi:NucA/NucB deoxyribonuclease domain-containing protein [Phyllobacterium sp. OV277]|uniref:NucA/NucB deoxyribonuclease domain-containing protein n=1 Tax=Phyllobacterium sp. OV277 TaxID=1882772 RepID=UPI00087FF2DF|nr:NucA/NucB deoxyribonuclease domain-containing protein [Phyllobacterium sp. OV277]SDP37443.1 Deoxyribonuclease NucA/NucB [Phyllobacterium sp. OV277]
MPFLGLAALPELALAGGGGALATTATVAGTGATVSTGTLLTGAAVVGTGLILSGDTPVNSVAAGVASPALTPEQQAERLKKVQELAKTLAKAAAASCATGNCCQRFVVISKSKSPLSAQHIEEAQAAGYPNTLTIDRAGTDARRAASLSGIPTRFPPYDRDEYPPATFIENAGAASVRYVPFSDNRSAGQQIKMGIAGAPEGCRVTITTGP